MPKVKCKDCHGHGEVSHTIGLVVECPTCKGEGEVVKKPNPEQMRKVAELIRKEGK